jgi:Protein of unknown function (DUF2380)
MVPLRIPVGVSSLLVGFLMGPAATGAQTSQNLVREPADAKVAVLDVAMYNAQANLQEPTDSAKAALATAVLDSTLGALLGPQLVAPEAVAAAEASPQALEAGAGAACNVRVTCARLVGHEVGAPWVVMAKVSKTSNLIWLLTGQLIHVATGDIILDDSTELKGDPDPMVRAGTRIFAERVARTVRAGGMNTNFPNGEPTQTTAQP